MRKQILLTHPVVYKTHHILYTAYTKCDPEYKLRIYMMTDRIFTIGSAIHSFTNLIHA